MSSNGSADSSRDLARRLLSEQPEPQPRADGRVDGRRTPSVARPRFGASFDDHPEVQAVALRNSVMRAMEAQTTLPNPLFLARSGPNTSQIDTTYGSLTNFSSYNYLGLAHHPAVIHAAQEALAQYGASASASRIVSGEIDLFTTLEARLAQIYDVEAAFITTSGFVTNAGLLAFLLGEHDAAICDSLIHGSVVSGLQWAGARRLSFRHNDLESLRDVLRTTRSHFQRVLVIIEGIYSMDGDVGDLPGIAALAREYDCAVMIDEAHSLGVLGDHGHGAREHFGMSGDGVDIWMGTLSKALGSCGGFIAGKASLIDAVRSNAPGLAMLTCGPSPAVAAAALAALTLVDDEPQRREGLWNNAKLFTDLLRDSGLNCGFSQGTPVCPVLVPGELNVAYASSLLLQRGIYAAPILGPAVPPGEERLRFFLTYDHTDEQLRTTAERVREVVTLVDDLAVPTVAMSSDEVQSMLATPAIDPVRS